MVGYLLDKLENSQHYKEPISVENYTIEHIMPQKTPLPKPWADELGVNWQQIHDITLHRNYHGKYMIQPFISLLKSIEVGS